MLYLLESKVSIQGGGWGTRPLLFEFSGSASGTNCCCCHLWTRNKIRWGRKSGTFDASILTMEEVRPIYVIHLGGRDSDLRVADYFRTQIINKGHGKDITSKEDFHRLSIVSEQEKFTLSSAKLSEVAEKDFNLETTITRTSLLTFFTCGQQVFSFLFSSNLRLFNIKHWMTGLVGNSSF